MPTPCGWRSGSGSVLVRRDSHAIHPGRAADQPNLGSGGDLLVGCGGLAGGLPPPALSAAISRRRPALYWIQRFSTLLHRIQQAMNQPLTAEDVWRLFAETDRLLKESNRDTERLLKEAALETDRRFQETDHRFQAADRRFQETERLMEKSSREVDQQLKELGKQIGGLGNKFGSFTEGLALPSMEKLLRERFGMTVISPRTKVRSGQEEIEIDVLAYANGEVNAVYLVEVKSHLDQRAIQQMLDLLERFPKLFPEHRDKALYGILAMVQGGKALRQAVLEQGLYLASIHDEQFRLDTPADFVPKRFNPEPGQ